mgnify:CR=1 FL=1
MPKNRPRRGRKLKPLFPGLTGPPLPYSLPRRRWRAVLRSLGAPVGAFRVLSRARQGKPVSWLVECAPALNNLGDALIRALGGK